MNNITSERLKELRLSLNKTQTEIAKELGITSASWSSYEKGKSDISLKVLLKTCETYNVSADWLLGLKNSQSMQGSSYVRVARALFDIESNSLFKINDNVVGSKQAYILFIDDQMIQCFLGEWQVILEMKRTNVINEKLYKLWEDAVLTDDYWEKSEDGSFFG